MTNRLKTVKTPRLILVECKNSEKISEAISDILNYCSYNTIIDRFNDNTDFVILTDEKNIDFDGNIIASTLVFDENSDMSDELIKGFPKKAARYDEGLAESSKVKTEGLTTYSSENYDADIMARNISLNGDCVSFDVIDEGILIRVRLKGGRYSVDDVLVCTAALVATGIPVASILGYFNHYGEK